MTASKGVHMKCADAHAIVYSSVCTVVKLHVVSPAHPVTKNAVDVVLMKNVPNVVQSRVGHASSHANGVVLITSAIIFVGNASAIDVLTTPPAPKSSIVDTLVLVCVEKFVPKCVACAMQRS